MSRSMNPLLLLLGFLVASTQAKCTVSVQNDSGSRIKCAVFNGKDGACLANKDCGSIGNGESKDFSCKGQGKDRCKVKCVAKGNTCGLITGCRKNVECDDILFINGGRRLGLGAGPEGGLEYVVHGFTPLLSDGIDEFEDEDEYDEYDFESALFFKDHIDEDENEDETGYDSPNY